jgi:hypothetical protein
VTVTNLPSGDHTVTVISETGTVENKIVVAPGATASVVFSLPKVSAPYGGGLSVSAPFDVDILERDEIVGASGTSRIMLAAGRHDVVLVNRGVGFQELRTLDIQAGKTTVVRIDPPKVPMSANARPWAEVLIDGSSVGQTPIANVILGIGPHQFVFRHPQFGERRQTLLVTAKGPNRVAVDFTKPE